MQHPELPERKRGEERLQQVWSLLQFPRPTFTFTFSFKEELGQFSLSLPAFNYSTFREELLEFWNPGQCSAQQYEELEGLEGSPSYEDDDEEFYEDEEVESMELGDSLEVHDHVGEH